MNITERIKNAAKVLSRKFAEIEETALFNQERILDAFRECKVSPRHFAGSFGYGYGDDGRDTLNKLYAKIFRADAALVSPHILSGTHAITAALFGILRPKDTLLSVTGTPYDTLKEVISGEGIGSLRNFGIFFDKVDLLNGKPNYKKIAAAVRKIEPKIVYIQRSKGYEWRAALTVSDISKITDIVRENSPPSVIFVDNCYGEFTEKAEPIESGADIIVGSLIKNPGGGLAPTGGYLAGKAELIELAAGRLTAPGIGAEIGSYAGGYRDFYQGLFIAPHTVMQALKGAYLCAEVMRSLGYEALPAKNDTASDIVCPIKFNCEEKLVAFCRAIQRNSPVDSHVTPYPWDMPGYENQVIMAAGTFVQGSSIELSCDSPLRPPYIAYIQGGLTYEHIKVALGNAVAELGEFTSS